MADKPRKDHWSSLLESIGLATATPQKPAAETASELAAEVPPAPVEAVPAAAEPAAPAPNPAAEAPKPAAKKPAKTSGHWGKLAGMLGLSVAQPEPEPEPTPEPPPPAPEPVFATPAAEIRTPPPPPQLSDDLPPDLFAPPARAEADSRTPAQPRERERSDRDRDRGRGQERREQRPAEARRDSREGGSERSERERGAHDRGGQERGGPDRGRGRGRDERREDSERRPPRRENPPRRGFGEGVSEDWAPAVHEEPAAEHFEDDFSPARDVDDEATPAAEERLGFDRPSDEEGGEHRRRRRRRRRGGRRDEAEAGSHETRSEHVSEERDEAPVEAYADEPFADDDFAPPAHEHDELAAEEDRPARRAPGDSEGGEDRGPRRRRRRRRGGRRDEGAEAPRSAPAPRDRDDDSELEDDFSSDRPSPPASRGRPQREQRRVPTEDDEVDEMLHAELDEEGGEGHAHKKIPTWQETVGVLIDGNMSMRSERPETRGGRGRRPPHRGR